MSINTATTLPSKQPFWQNPVSAPQTGLSVSVPRNTHRTTMTSHSLLHLRDHPGNFEKLGESRD